MQKPVKISLLFAMVLTCCRVLTGQQDVDLAKDITFDAFTGTVYAMPLEEHEIDPAFIETAKERGGIQKDGRWYAKKIAERYSDKVPDYPRLGEITLETINIPETGEGAFPGVERTSQFCMLLHSTMYVKTEGCYAFSLNSDDGSILWIDDVEVVNNDGGHYMRLAMDSVGLREGSYTVRLWYFQAYYPLGFQFNARRVGDLSACDTLKRTESYVRNTTVLFNTGVYTLSDSAVAKLNKFLEGLPAESILSIEIIGHTDAIGSIASNQTLSQKRAATVADRCRLYFPDKKIDATTIGKGESQPKATNDSDSGRAENRRVEIRVVLRW